MHPGEDSGHVIDLGLDGSMMDDQSASQIPFLSSHHDLDEDQTANENNFQQVEISTSASFRSLFSF